MYSFLHGRLVFFLPLLLARLLFSGQVALPGQTPPAGEAAEQVRRIAQISILREYDGHIPLPFSLRSIPASLSTSGLVLPRFVALKRTKLALLAGPGKDHATLKILHGRNLPLLVVQETVTGWRRVITAEGAVGWVFKRDLKKGGRFVRLIDPSRPVWRKKTRQSGQQVFLESDKLLEVTHCSAQQCRLLFADTSGKKRHYWAMERELWGIGCGVEACLPLLKQIDALEIFQYE